MCIEPNRMAEVGLDSLFAQILRQLHYAMVTRIIIVEFLFLSVHYI